MTALVLFLVPAGAGAAQIETLYQFSGGADGGSLNSPLTVDRAGKLYGAADSGGQGYGVIFELSPPASQGGTRTESTLYTFTGATGVPNGGLTLDSGGNLYGTTTAAVFRLAPPTAGGPWTYSMLYQFPVGGWQPSGSLVFDTQGNLYGTDMSGGTGAGPYFGQVYELSPTAGGGHPWSFTALYNLRGIPDGQYPSGGVIFDSQGNLYGVTNQDGTSKCTDDEGYPLGCGTVFELSPASGGWTESILYNFTVHQDNFPSWGVTLSRDDTLYGTAIAVVYVLAPPSQPGDAWRYKTIYRFTDTLPESAVIFDSHGNLYGTAAGLSPDGSIYEISPPAQTSGQWSETTLGFVGDGLIGGVVRGAFGGLYGTTFGNGTTTFGSVFEIILSSSNSILLFLIDTKPLRKVLGLKLSKASTVGIK